LADETFEHSIGRCLETITAEVPLVVWGLLCEVSDPNNSAFHGPHQALRLPRVKKISAWQHIFPKNQ